MSPLQTLKGFRDILPAEKRQRDWVATKIAQVFQRHGFEPVETPTLEYAELLLGKYGTEADKLVYQFADRGDRQVALRYDQTVPTARLLAQYQHQLPKYFRRYQIQNVFRADKPQKGRYREFTQCDCDIFGSPDVTADAEILAVYAAVYQELGLTSLVIELNDRQTLLTTLSPFVTDQVDVFSLVQSIDKLDKMTTDQVMAELTAKGLSPSQAQQALDHINQAAISPQLQRIIDAATALGVPQNFLKVNPALARGLDYYTGLIFEGKITDYPVGSVGGGGRYDKLIEQLSGLAIPAVGFGIGFDRTVEAAVQLGLVPPQLATSQVLVTVFAEQYLNQSLNTAAALRAAGIKTEVFPGTDNLTKQFKLADQKQIPFVIILGESEVAHDLVTLKDMRTGKQQQLSLTEVIQQLSSTV